MSAQTSKTLFAVLVIYIHATHGGHGVHTTCAHRCDYKSACRRTTRHKIMRGSQLFSSIWCSVQQSNLLRIRGGEPEPVLDLQPSVKEVNKGLECTICCNFLCAPRTLFCGHSFCEQCILSWTRSGHKNCPSCSSAISARSTECPSFALELACRHIYRDEYNRRLQELEDLQLDSHQASARSCAVMIGPSAS
jgi:hypothetical protein